MATWFIERWNGYSPFSGSSPQWNTGLKLNYKLIIPLYNMALAWIIMWIIQLLPGKIYSQNWNTNIRQIKQITDCQTVTRITGKSSSWHAAFARKAQRYITAVHLLSQTSASNSQQDVMQICHTINNLHKRNNYSAETDSCSVWRIKD